jgi:hypothetical protein
MENTTTVSDTEVYGYINGSLAELHGLKASLFEDYGLKLATFTVSTGNTYTLPSDFLKLRRLEFQVNTANVTWAPLTATNLQEYHRYNRVIFYTGWRERAYFLRDTDVFLLPETAATGDYRIWYTPNWTNLSPSAINVDNTNGWEEYAVLDAAIKCLSKEESDISDLMARKSIIKNRIEGEASNRDAGQPKHVLDLWLDDYEYGGNRRWRP